MLNPLLNVTILEDAALLTPLSDALVVSAGQQCRTLGHCRTIWNIIWSCIVTIFACIWIAVHPNIPQPKAPRERSTLLGLLIDTCSNLGEKLIVATVALLAPEFIFAWSLRQWLVARSIASDCQQVASERDTKIAAGAMLKAHARVTLPPPGAESQGREGIEIKQLEAIFSPHRTRWQNGRLEHLHRKASRRQPSERGKPE